ncbi:MAG: hypothetical protein ACRDYU_03870 [Actinomycetes bacterium]
MRRVMVEPLGADVPAVVLQEAGDELWIVSAQAPSVTVVAEALDALLRRLEG